MGKTRQTGNIVSDGLVSVDIANDQFKVGSGVTIYGSSGIISATSLYVGGTQVTGAASGISSVADDTTPRLGGDLDLNSNDITGTGNFNVTGVITATSYDGQVKLSLEESDTTNYLTFANDSQGYQTLKSNTGLAFNASNGTLTAAYFTGNGSNLTNVDATTLDSIDSGSFLRSDQLDYVTSGGIVFNDSIRLYLGTGAANDAELFYDGTNSYFNVASGDLIIATKGGEYAGDDIIIESADDFEVRLNAGTNIGAGTTAIYATGGGSVALTHNGSTKFETTNTGIDVTGIVTATSVSVGSTTNIIRKVTDVNSWVAADADTSFSVTSQQNAPTGLYFKSDGTKMFVTGTQSPRDVEEYALSSAWDITTASHTTGYSINSQDTSPQGLYFSPNGENMFVAGNSSDSILHYTLSTGWDLTSTVSYVGNFSVSSQASLPTGVTFGDSGTKMYVVGRTNDSINQYNLSSAYTITSGVTHAHTLDIGQSSSIIGTPNGFANPHGISISSDGTKIWIIGTAEDIIAQFNLGTAYDLSTATYNGDFTNIFWAATTSYDFYIDESAEKGFILFAGTDDSVREIDITNPGLSIEANPTVRSANINLNNNVQVKGKTWFEEAIIVNGSQLSYFQHDVQVQGKLNARGVIDLADGSADRIQFGGSDDAKIYYDGTDNYFDLQFSTADNNGFRILDNSDSELFRVAKDGKVGINSTSPTADLDVGGHVNVSGALTATSFVKATNSSGFLKADGTEDTSTYLTSYTETQTLDNVVGLGSTTTQTISVGNLNVTGTGNTSTITGATNLVLDPAAVGDNTGKVVILGNLQVDGTTTEINSTTLTVDDKSIVLASGAADSAAANGAGIEIDGASATFQYAHTGTKWVANKSIEATSFIKNGGASTEFLKADGSVDTSTYITSADGGNAATLDGVDSTSFLRSDAADTKTSGNLTFNDSIQANFGTNSDLRISHDGTDNHIMSADKDLNIELSPDGATPKIYIRPTTSHQGITLGGGSGNPVELYHTNAKKFETTGSGAIVTGVLTATSFSGSGSSLTGLTGASAATYGSATATPVIVVDSDGRITGISTVATSGSGGGGGTPGGSDGQIQYNNSGSFGGAAQLYYDDGNNRLGINSSTPAYSLDLGESASTIRLVSENGGTAIRIGAGDYTNDFTLLRVDGMGVNHDGESDSAAYGFSFKYLGSGSGNNNTLQILSDNQEGTAVQAFTMLQDGKIGIANTTPSTELEVGGTITATNYTGKIYIDESADDDAEHNLVFIDAAWSSGDQGNAHLDLEIDSGGITFNPSTNTLTVPTIVASLTGVASSATKVYVDESEDDDANYHVMFSDVTPGGGNEYRTLQVDTNGIQFNPSSNHLKINGDIAAVAIGTNRSTNIDASVEIDHNELVGTAYTNSMVTDYNGNIRITADEPTIELIGSDDGSHAASIYMRNVNEGYAFINNPATEELELKSFTASANAFHATGSNGANLSSLNKILRIGKDGNIGVGNTDAAFKLDVDGGVRVSSGSSITFAGPTTTGALYQANNADTTLLRVTSAGSTANLSGDYGFTLKYLGSGTGNNNKLQILSDNQTAGTQVEAFTMLQDGKVGIANTTPTSTLGVGGTITATSFVKSSNSGGFLKADGTEDTNTYLTTAASEAFKTIAVSGQSDVVADSATDTLTLVAGSNMTITTNASGDSITFTSSGGGGGSGSIGIQSGGVLVGTATTINFGSGATITNNVASVSVGSTTRFVGARLYHNDYTLAGTNAWRKIVDWDGTAIDTNSFVDTSDGFTIPAGVSKIRITAGVKPSTGGVNNQWSLYKNGVGLAVNNGGFYIEAESNTGYNSGSSTGTSAVLSVSQGDTFDIRCYNSSTTPTWDIFLELEVIEGDILGTYFSANNIVDDTSPQLGGDLDLNGNDITGIGTIDVTGNLSLTSTNAGNSTGPDINLYRNSASPYPNDNLSVIRFYGQNDADEKTAYAWISSKISDETDGTEDGELKFSVAQDGTVLSRLFLQGNGKTLFTNQDIGLSTNVDLVFEGATFNANETILTVVDPTGINTITLPDATGTVLLNVVEDTTPQLGGDLDLNSKNITGTGNIDITGTLDVSGITTFQNNVKLLDSDFLKFGTGEDFTIGHSWGDNTITMLSGNLTFTDSSSNSRLQLTNNGDWEFKNNAGTTKFKVVSAGATVIGDLYATTLYGDGSNLTGISTYSDGSVDSHLNQSNPTSGYVLSWNGSDYAWVAQSGGGGGVGYFTTTTSGVNYTGIGTSSAVGIGTIIEIIPYDTQNSGTLSFEASAGQLFSITNNLSSGSIFSVNDISGIPSIDVDADGTVLVAPYSTTEKVGVGTTNPSYKMDVVGDINFTGTLYQDGSVFNPGVTPSGGEGAVQFNSSSNLSGISTLLSVGSTTFSVGIGTIIDIKPYDTQNSGTLSFEASAGQLFSITNNLTSGSIFSVNDVSGIPSIDVNADGTVLVAPYSTTEKVGIGTTNPTHKLHVVGDVEITGTLTNNGSAVGGGSGVSDGDKGDITVSNSGATWAIDSDAVTYAKIQNVTATNRILGRDSAGAGVIEEITPANVRTMLNVADGANAYSHPNHTGDVTSTGDGATVIAGSAVTTTKIADDAVTYAKIQNVATANRVLGSTSADGVVSELQIATDMVSDDAVTYAKIQNVTATNRILGRDSSGAGVIEEITPANVRTMLNVADGATAYANTNVDSHLNTSSASNNEVLSWNGSDYAWVAQSGGGGGGTGVASTITVADESSDTTCFPIFSTAATGDINPKTGSNLTFNSSDGTLTATSFVGVAQSATKVYVDESEDDDVYYNLIFTDENPDAGDKYHGLQVDDGGIRFNPGSNTLAVQNLAGIATGATRVYIDESEDDDVYYNVIFSDENPDPGDKYHRFQVDDNGLGFNPGANTLYVANVRISNSISNITNSNTKFGFIGTTGFYVETNDIERLSVLENGNVGIGSTIPTTVLDVGGTITATSFVKSGGTSSQYLMADGSTSTSGGGGGGGGVSQAKATAISMVFG